MQISVLDNLSDSHFHITEMIDKNINIDDFCSQWIENKGNKLIDISVDEYNFEQRSLYSAKYDFIYHTIGIHPNNAKGSISKRLKTIESIINDNNIIAIGETGLDYYWKDIDPKIQKDFFIAQIELSIKYNLPLVIHNREASNDIIEILKRYRGKIRGIIHCYSEDIQFIQEFIDLNFYISFSGNITYKNSVQLQDYLVKLPLERLLIETDSPYLSPMPNRGKLNTPLNLQHTFNFIADKINIDHNILKNILHKNLLNIFNIEE